MAAEGEVSSLGRRREELTPAIINSVCQMRYDIYTYTKVRECLPARLPPAQVTALHLACLYGQREVVDILLDMGADPNRLATVTHVGGRPWQVSPLCEAASMGHPDICRVLLAHGARLDVGVNPMNQAMTEEIRMILRGR